MGADVVLFVRYGTENAFSLIPFFVAIPYDVLTAEGVAIRRSETKSAVPTHLAHVLCKCYRIVMICRVRRAPWRVQHRVWTEGTIVEEGRRLW